MDKHQQPPPYGAHIPNQPMPMPMGQQQMHMPMGPQQMHIPMGQPTPTVQIVTATQLGPEPMPTVCPHCHAHITTNIRHEPSSKTHLYAMIMCLLGGWCCVCIPYCVDSCQNANHYCPACQSYLGAYQN